MMSKTLITFLFLLFTQPVFAEAEHDEIVSALKNAYPLGGFSVSGAEARFMPDFFSHGYGKPTPTEIDSLVANYTAIDNVRARRIAEIKQQAVERFKGYELYADMQSVIDYKAALRAVPTAAATEMAALPDVASVKNYQPAWPAKPNL